MQWSTKFYAKVKLSRPEFRKLQNIQLISLPIVSKEEYTKDSKRSTYRRDRFSENPDPATIGFRHYPPPPPRPDTLDCRKIKIPVVSGNGTKVKFMVKNIRKNSCRIQNQLKTRIQIWKNHSGSKRLDKKIQFCLTSADIPSRELGVLASLSSGSTELAMFSCTRPNWKNTKRHQNYGPNLHVRSKSKIRYGS